ncbi:hypothetical protein [Streptomyces sp. SLBN-31]|uniref:hypothetical protein n=1 Tax=Streptomyces sp. SLBN-31 TaxID=2768444 RepID=UPI00117435F6|nr:hypothetical protein [Streptomyces sp. SLBN-31]TQJ93003.1 hypothetical protein FBY22_3957 [Streptomyces sp. SLBN-31]
MSSGTQLPTGQPSDDDAVLSEGARIAAQWRDLGAEQLGVALRAMEPQLRREHRERMLSLELQREAEQRQHEDRQRERADRRSTVELVTGAVIALAMLGGGVYLAPEHGWLSALLCGPSLLALAKVFVLKRSDPADMQAVLLAGQLATRAAVQAQEPQQQPQQPPTIP